MKAEKNYQKFRESFNSYVNFHDATQKSIKCLSSLGNTVSSLGNTVDKNNCIIVKCFSR